jgi:transcriptional regulator with XRE-family HTH domain
MDHRNHNKIFGTVLKDFRKNAEKSQEALAFESGLDRTYISLLELGRRSPTLDTMLALCQALNISFVTLASSLQEKTDNNTNNG